MNEIINENHKNITNNQILATSIQQQSKPENHIDEMFSANIIYEENLIEKNSEEVSSSEKINIEDANTTNCLALTIKKDYKLVAVKNVVLHSLKVTWKVIVSAITLNILKFIF